MKNNKLLKAEKELKKLCNRKRISDDEFYEKYNKLNKIIEKSKRKSC